MRGSQRELADEIGRGKLPRGNCGRSIEEAVRRRKMCLSLRPFGWGKATLPKPALVAKAGELIVGGGWELIFILC